MHGAAPRGPAGPLWPHAHSPLSPTCQAAGGQHRTRPHAAGAPRGPSPALGLSTSLRWAPPASAAPFGHQARAAAAPAHDSDRLRAQLARGTARRRRRVRATSGERGVLV